MKRKRGFTLIELLVVIAIIALLMSILMPALSKVRQSAKDAACAMNARQWGVIFNMYTSDNDSYFTDGQRSWGNAAGIGDWLSAMWDDYISKDPRILMCSMATNPAESTPLKYRAWGGGPGYEEVGYIPEGHRDTTGSYAFNAWCNNFPITQERWEYDPKFCWRTTTVSGASNVPVLPDSIRWGCNPLASDTPAEYDGGPGGQTDTEMRRVCLDRHGGAINILFMDWSSRRVGLKDLWDVETKWHRNWTKEWEEADVEGMDWPDWMRNF